jgi:KDO2-lipid IV(A) lauroyltransferase
MSNLIKAYLAETVRLIYWVPVRWFVRALPQGLSYRFARLSGALFFFFSGNKKARLAHGFRFLFGDGDFGNEIRNTFENYALNSIEVFLYPGLTKDKLASMVEYHGMDHIARARAKGKGVILLHGHFGNEEFLMPAFSFAVDCRVNQLASRWEPPVNKSVLYRFPDSVRRYAFRMRIGHREALPVNFIYIDKGIKGAYRALNNNEILLLAADGREGTSWVEVDFMGRLALYSDGPMRIAQRTKAEVLPVFLVRGPDNRHRLIVEEPLPLEWTNDNDRDLRVNTQKFADRLGAYVKKYPCHYMKLFWQDMRYFKELTP